MEGTWSATPSGGVVLATVRPFIFYFGCAENKGAYAWAYALFAIQAHPFFDEPIAASLHADRWAGRETRPQLRQSQDAERFALRTSPATNGSGLAEPVR